MKRKRSLELGITSALVALGVGFLSASSHMDAPLITLDDAANTTDVYAFRSAGGYLTTALGVYPFEEPGIGPNKYNFDDNVLYEIHVAIGDDLMAGRKTISYQFQFNTTFQDENTILQSYRLPGVVQTVGDEAQNLIQAYTVKKIDHRTDVKTELMRVDGSPLLVPPNNQGLATPKYNQGNNGENPAKEGVSAAMDLDEYTASTVHDLVDGYLAFAGQRDDGFYADIQSIFDLDLGFGGPNKPFDSQGGFNIHTIVLNIPLDELGGANQVVGVYATTSRPRVTVLRDAKAPNFSGEFVQVGRQGNPLFCEALVAIVDKDLYNRTSPENDMALFSQYATNVELGALLGTTPDLSAIYIPDVIKVDLSTPPARLAGPTDDTGFSRLSFFGEDFLASTVAGGPVPGGFPNGRRFGDDVLDIAVLAIAGSPVPAPVALQNIDKVPANDITFNKVFPYAATPHNGRNHPHH